MLLEPTVQRFVDASSVEKRISHGIPGSGYTHLAPCALMSPVQVMRERLWMQKMPKRSGKDLLRC